MISRILVLTALCLLAARPSTAFAPQANAARADTSLAFFGNNKKSAAAPAVSSAQSSPAANDAVDFFVAKYGAKRINNPIDESKLRGNFAEIVRIFGEDDAITIYTATPQVLEFKATSFQPIIDIFDDNFGVDKGRATLIRNPALLGIKPDAQPGPETVTLSYVVAATRPLGNFGIAGLFTVLAVPGIDAVTGLGIRDAFLHTLGVR